MDNFTRNAKLVRVIDGDTVVLDIDLGFNITLRSQTCRLLGINAPEVRGKQRLQGLESKKFLQNLLRDAALNVRCREFKRCSFGRWLIDLYVVLPKGGMVLVNALIIQEGFALKDRR